MRRREACSRKNALDLIRRRYSVGDPVTPASGCVRPVHAIHQACYLPWPSLPCSVCKADRSAARLRRARRRRDAQSPAAMAGTLARSAHRGACGAVSAARRWTVSVGRDRARLDPERAASRPNAATRIPRACGVAGGARLCRAGSGTSGSWRDRRQVPRGSGRLRRGRLCQVRARHGGRDCGRGWARAQAILHPAGWHRRRRPFGRRVGCAGAGQRGPEGCCRHHRVRAGPRRPRQ